MERIKRLRSRMLCLLLCLCAFSAKADVMTLSGSYQASRENEKGEYLVLAREGNGAEIIAYDDEDQVLWEKVFEAQEGESAAWAAFPVETGWIVAGASSKKDAQWHEGWYDSYQPTTDGWLALLDAEGDLLWEKRLGGSGTDVFWDVCADGEIIIAAGESDSTDGDLLTEDNRQKEGWLVCLNVEGEVLWNKTFGGQYDDALRGAAFQSGGILSAGWSTGEEGDRHGWWIMTNKKGDVLSQRLEKEVSALYDLAPAGENSALAVGVYNDSAWIMELDGEGLVIQNMIRRDEVSNRALCAAWYPKGFWAVAGESVGLSEKTDWLIRYHHGRVELVQGTYEVE